MPMNPVDEFCATMELVTGRRPSLSEAVALLLEAALQREGWLRSGMPAIRGGDGPARDLVAV